MGFLDRFMPSARGRDAPSLDRAAREEWDYAAAQRLTNESPVAIYENTSLTVRGEPTGYDFAGILRDPQANMEALYKLSSYYRDADPMFGGAIRNVYVPFSTSRSYRFTGPSEDVKAKYEEHYRNIGFRDRMVSILDQLFTFNNVFIYLMPNGNIISLMPTRCRIDDVYTNGEPLISYDTQDLMKIMTATGSSTQAFIKAREARLRGLPPEVAAELKKRNPSRWVQLDPDNVFALQAPKPDWVRYAVPPIAPCLNALSRKALISEYEKAQLQYGIKGFLHVKVGDKDKDSGMNKPDSRHITQMFNTFESALKSGKLAVTPWYVNAEFVTVDTRSLFDKDKYAGVNAEILSACGISGVVVAGQQESGSYGEAKLSLETVALRITQAQQNFAEMMDKINLRLSERVAGLSKTDIPHFEFPPVDLTNDGKFAEAVLKLWTQGMASNQTLLESYNLDIAQELERKKTEEAAKQRSIFLPPQNAYTSDTGKAVGNNAGGRPKKPLGDRISDPEKSETGAQPKPSNPDGS